MSENPSKWIYIVFYDTQIDPKLSNKIFGFGRPKMDFLKVLKGVKVCELLRDSFLPLQKIPQNGQN